MPLLNKHSVTAPCGTVLTRNSKTRLYTHVVVMLQSHFHAQHTAKNPSDTTIRQNTSDYHYFVRKGDKGRLRGATDLAGYLEARKQAELSRVAKAKAENVYDKYIAVGWSSRYDLAQKVYAQYAAREGVADLQILEVRVR